MLQLIAGLLTLLPVATSMDFAPRPEIAACTAPIAAGHKFKNSSGFDVTVGPIDNEGHRDVKIREGGPDGYEDDGFLDGQTYVSTTWGSVWTWIWVPFSTPDGTVWKMVFFDETGFLVDWWTPVAG